MLWMSLVMLVLIGCFAVVLLYGAPYLPTLKPQVELALDMLNLAPGQTLLELGCGDGVVLLAAAHRGLKAVGYELNPIMVAVAWLRTWRYHKNGQVTVKWANFWQVDWPPADAIFTFLLQKYTEKLDTKIVQYTHKPVKLVSFAFAITSRRPSRTKKGLYLYEYR